MGSAYFEVYAEGWRELLDGQVFSRFLWSVAALLRAAFVRITGQLFGRREAFEALGEFEGCFLIDWSLAVHAIGFGQFSSLHLGFEAYTKIDHRIFCERHILTCLARDRAPKPPREDLVEKAVAAFCLADPFLRAHRVKVVY